MYSNPDRTLSEIMAVQASAQRAEGKVDLHVTSGELAYRAGTENRFSQSTAAFASGGLMDSARRKLSFASDGAE